MGQVVLGNISKCMIQGEFVGSVGLEAVHFSEGQFGLAAETLDRARRMCPAGAEPV